MAFMVPVVKKEWDIYGSGSARKRSRGAQTRAASAGARATGLTQGPATGSAVVVGSPSPNDVMLVGSAPVGHRIPRSRSNSRFPLRNHAVASSLSSGTGGADGRRSRVSGKEGTGSGNNSGDSRKLVFGPRTPPQLSPDHLPLTRLSQSVPVVVTMPSTGSSATRMLDKLTRFWQRSNDREQSRRL